MNRVTVILVFVQKHGKRPTDIARQKERLFKKHPLSVEITLTFKGKSCSNTVHLLESYYSNLFFASTNVWYTNITSSSFLYYLFRRAESDIDVCLPGHLGDRYRDGEAVISKRGRNKQVRELEAIDVHICNTDVN